MLFDSPMLPCTLARTLLFFRYIFNDWTLFDNKSPLNFSCDSKQAASRQCWTAAMEPTVITGNIYIKILPNSTTVIPPYLDPL